MAPDTVPPAPGSMTVPPLFGWELIATVLVLLIVVAVAFVVIATTRVGTDERSEWQAWLDARSSRRQGPPTTPEDRPTELIGRGSR